MGRTQGSGAGAVHSTTMHSANNPAVSSQLSVGCQLPQRKAFPLPENRERHGARLDNEASCTCPETKLAKPDEMVFSMFDEFIFPSCGNLSRRAPLETARYLSFKFKIA